MKPFARPMILGLSLCLLLAACEPTTGVPPATASPSLTFTPTITAPTSTPSFLTPVLTPYVPDPTPSPTPVPYGWLPPAVGSPSGILPVIGYLPDYQKLNPDWDKSLTDLIYFSAEPLTDGRLDASRLNPATLQAMQTMKTRYGTHLFISLGGDGRSANFGPMVTSPKARRKFSDALVAFAHDNSLDGIDFDWEFPVSQAEVEGYLALMTAVKRAGLTVSVAIYPYTDIDLQPYGIADRVYIMSYDRGVKHASLDQAITDLESFLGAGLPRDKLFLGVPFYGRQTTDPFTPFAYADILKAHAPAPGTDEVDGIYFNGTNTMQEKVCYVRRNGFGGVMIWELGQDSVGDGSLLKAIHAAATGSCKP